MWPSSQRVGFIPELGLASCLMFWPKPIRVSLLSYPSLPLPLTHSEVSRTHPLFSPLPSSCSSRLHCCSSAAPSPPLLPSGSQLLLPPFQLPSLSSLRLLLLQAHRPADRAGVQVEVYMPEADVQGEVGFAPASSVETGSAAAGSASSAAPDVASLVEKALAKLYNIYMVYISPHM